MKFVADPLAWLWFGLLIGSGVLFLRRRMKLAWALLAIVVLTSIAQATNMSARLLASLERPYAASAPLTDAQSTDAVLVLGGYMAPCPASPLGLEFKDAVDRLLTGIALVREGRSQVLVLSPGNPTEVARAEAGLATDWIKRWNLLDGPAGGDARMLLLAPAKNTHEEARQMSRLAQEKHWKTVALVTSAWHMRRAAATFRKAGVEVVPVGCDFQGMTALESGEAAGFIPRTQSLVLFRTWAEEVLGYAFYWVRGWIG